MDGTYIVVRGIEPDTNLVQTLAKMLDSADIRDDNLRLPKLTIGSAAEIFIDHVSRHEACIAMGPVNGDPHTRNVIARHIYATLVRNTEWSLRWTSDEHPRFIRSRCGRAAATQLSS